MAYDYRAEGKCALANPNHPDLVDPYRELRKLVRPMKPEEEDQKPYDFGNVKQNQLAVDGYASKVEAMIGGRKREGQERLTVRLDKGIKSGHSQATRPGGVPYGFPTLVKP